MHEDAVGRLVTLAAFGIAGTFLARAVRLPVPARTWALLVLAAAVGSFVGVRTRLIATPVLTIYLNRAIASTCLGLLAGLWLRTRARRAADGR